MGYKPIVAWCLQEASTHGLSLQAGPTEMGVLGMAGLRADTGREAIGFSCSLRLVWWLFWAAQLASSAENHSFILFPREMSSKRPKSIWLGLSSCPLNVPWGSGRWEAQSWGPCCHGSHETWLLPLFSNFSSPSVQTHRQMYTHTRTHTQPLQRCAEVVLCIIVILDLFLKMFE